MSKVVKRMISYVGKVKLSELPAEFQASVEGVSKQMEAKVRDSQVSGRLAITGLDDLHL
jgi:hypothetical protein